MVLSSRVRVFHIPASQGIEKTSTNTHTRPTGNGDGHDITVVTGIGIPIRGDGLLKGRGLGSSGRPILWSWAVDTVSLRFSHFQPPASFFPRQCLFLHCDQGIFPSVIHFPIRRDGSKKRQWYAHKEKRRSSLSFSRQSPEGFSLQSGDHSESPPRSKAFQ